MRYALWSNLSPSQVLVLVTILGALLLPVGRGLLGRWLSLAGGASLLLLGVLPTAQYLLDPLQARFPRPNLPARLDGILLMAGCFGYLVTFFGRLLVPEFSELAFTRYISLPGSIGEIGTCLWLLIMGVRERPIAPSFTPATIDSP